MEILEKLRQWLLSYPGWGGCSLSVGCVQTQPGTAGLYLTGIDEYDRQTDLQGNVLARNRLQLQLRYNVAAEEEKSGWLVDMADWLRQHCSAGEMPRLGCLADGQRVCVKQGKLAQIQGQTASYQLDFTVEYWVYWEAFDND